MQLARLFEGWDGYQTSLLHAATPLTPAQLAWRPAPERRSIGELIRHIALGRVTWLARMSAPGIEAVAERVPRWFTDGDQARHPIEDSVPADDASVLAQWLELTWQPIRNLLDTWTPDDLAVCYTHRFRGTNYSVSRQWTLWRVLSHDTHHGGQLALLLALAGIDAFELRGLGGHITVPPNAEP
jgi:uncharacterized damage-inducible protein DinB